MKDSKTFRTVYNICVLIILLIGIVMVINHFVRFGDGEYTDNATVQQHITPVNARVGGFIKEIRFNEYQPVHRGDTLVIIEDSEFRLLLAQAEASLQRELAGGAATTSGIDVTRQNINVNDASIEEARVRMENAKNDDERYAQLLKADAVPGEEYEGVVERISDATGSAFSMIPQDNATGNFVKVEQRIPVRISLKADSKKLEKLRAGMNVECVVEKKD